MSKPKCSQESCAERAIVAVEDGKCLCQHHIIEHINSPGDGGASRARRRRECFQRINGGSAN
jgi:hypothetical protein